MVTRKDGKLEEMEQCANGTKGLRRKVLGPMRRMIGAIYLVLYMKGDKV